MLPLREHRPKPDYQSCKPLCLSVNSISSKTTPAHEQASFYFLRAFQTIQPVVSRKKRSFSFSSGRAVCTAASCFTFFKVETL